MQQHKAVCQHWSWTHVVDVIFFTVNVIKHDDVTRVITRLLVNFRWTQQTTDSTVNSASEKLKTLAYTYGINHLFNSLTGDVQFTYYIYSAKRVNI